MMRILACLRQQKHHQQKHRPGSIENSLSVKTYGAGHRQVAWLSASIALSGLASVTLVDVAVAQVPPTSVQDGYRAQADGRSESTAALQRQLANLGYYNGEITGYFGPQTQEAVIRFQQDRGLVPDGIVGPATAQALSQSGGGASGRGGESQSADRLPSIQLNDGGEQVAELQRRLSDLGYNTSVSGVFDYPTEAAVMQFQRDNGLFPDGVVGPSTEEALRRPNSELVRPSESSPSSSSREADRSNGVLRLGDTGTAVSDLQLRLKELGFYQGEVSGVYGPETEASVLAFQQSQGLTTDGVAGPQVNSSLFSFNHSTPEGSPGSYSSNVGGTSSDVSEANNPENAAGTASTGPTEASTPAVSVPPIDGTPSANPQPTGSQTGVPPESAPPAAESGTISPQTLQQLEQAQTEAEQARLEAERARLEAEQARMVLFQNMDEGRYSVASLQRQLRNNGFDPGNVNGVFTTDTQAAILEAQRTYGLTESDLFNDAGSSGSAYPFPY
ncbi:peptidoglycan-binding domain-containing protein [Egbenema bharatensis]|uniref:peptidoglycan-binding domain-containing protein n=1 Tax=Egbenema bharatensis TaxID=3463334 RepID=UPI003A87EF9B